VSSSSGKAGYTPGWSFVAHSLKEYLRSIFFLLFAPRTGTTAKVDRLFIGLRADTLLDGAEMDEPTGSGCDDPSGEPSGLEMQLELAAFVFSSVLATTSLSDVEERCKRPEFRLTGASAACGSSVLDEIFFTDRFVGAEPGKTINSCHNADEYYEFSPAIEGRSSSASDSVKSITGCSGVSRPDSALLVLNFQVRCEYAALHEEAHDFT
jgi:hypothetical protein